MIYDGTNEDIATSDQIYLRNLPTLACRTLSGSTSTFARASSFTASPWVNSQSHISTSATTPDNYVGSLQTPTATPSKEPPRSGTRYLFTDSEIELLTRNAEEVLELHEHFLKELRLVMEPLGYSMDPEESDEDTAEFQARRTERIEAAIGAVSTKFATEV